MRKQKKAMVEVSNKVSSANRARDPYGPLWTSCDENSTTCVTTRYNSHVFTLPSDVIFRTLLPVDWSIRVAEWEALGAPSFLCKIQECTVREYKGCNSSPSPYK